MQNKSFDFIIAGAGAAGLSLLLRMIKSGAFTGKQILLVDKAPKTDNDRTWCFWEKGNGFFEEIVHKSWESILIYNNNLSKKINILPYRYKMIRGIDFYNYCFELIRKQNNVTIRFGNVKEVQDNKGIASIKLDGEYISSEFIFNSIRLKESVSAKGKYNLLQHFTGWIVKASQDIFDHKTATLMDFRTPQNAGCSFVYTMPFSADSALVEYTVFGKEILAEEAYTSALRSYLASRYPGISYEVVSTEFGVIPMTDFSFPAIERNLIHIGTAGGQTKPSSGYTFQFIQKRTDAILEKLLKGESLSSLPGIPLKYRFYDRVLLNVLATGKQEGSDVFTTLFEKNPVSRIFRFLDNDSSLADDIQLISTLPVWPFLKASFE